MVLHPIALGIAVFFAIATLKNFGEDHAGQFSLIIGALISAAAVTASFWPF